MADTAQETAPAAPVTPAAPVVTPPATTSTDAALKTIAPPPAVKADAAVAVQPVKVPDKYELKLPDGSLLDTQAVEKIAAYAKGRGLSNEEAQAYLERQDEAVESYVESQKTSHEARAKAWVEELKTDKDFGGEAFGKNAELSKRVVDRFFPPEFKKALDESGMGNYPPLVKGFAAVGRAMSDDQLVIPMGQLGGKRSPEDIFYGGSTKKENA